MKRLGKAIFHGMDSLYLNYNKIEFHSPDANQAMCHWVSREACHVTWAVVSFLIRYN